MWPCICFGVTLGPLLGDSWYLGEWEADKLFGLIEAFPLICNGPDKTSSLLLFVRLCALLRVCGRRGEETHILCGGA